MFNRLARLWGKKSEAEQGPEITATDRAARRGKGETVAESLERYRQERAEEERQAKEAYTRDAEARYGPAATWPRLSETLDGPRHPRFCQSCGVERPPEASDEATPARGGESDEGVAKANDKAKADDSFRLIKAALEPPPGVYGWQEHDGRDEPEPIAVMLCTTCSKRLISPHPRVYSSIPRNAPFPGIMDLCIERLSFPRGRHLHPPRPGEQRRRGPPDRRRARYVGTRPDSRRRPHPDALRVPATRLRPAISGGSGRRDRRRTHGARGGNKP